MVSCPLCRKRLEYQARLQSKEFKIYSCSLHDELILLKIPINRYNSIPRGLSIYAITMHKRYTSSNNKNKVSLDEDKPTQNTDNW